MDTAPDTPAAEGETRPSHFIREMIEADLAAGRHQQVVTRFPPEPNGWLHIGHAKSICLNFGLAKDFGGVCRLRFDDTNPTTEDVSYVEAIQRDVRWLGWEWEGEVRFASDYFDFMYEYAVDLIRQGKAYVDGSTLEQIREGRGTVYEPGTPSPDRDRPVEESLDLFARMKAGEFPDGAYVLRAKIDMAATNMLLRDPLLYRIRHAHHYRTGDTWCLYPMYDFAHCLEDAYEGVTHSLCTLEFDNNRALYDWVLDNGHPPSRPHQTEFARLALAHTVVSKRKLLRLVGEGHVAGWDDPRMPTLAGLRRRGVTPEAIRAFCDRVGVAKKNNLVDLGLLDYCIRDDLNARAPRVLAVLDPLEVEISTWPEGEVDTLDAPSWPDDVDRQGSRPLPFTRRLVIERDDFAEDPPAGWKRLAPGREVRLRHGYLITCDEVVKDDDGRVVRLRCHHDPDSRGGNAPDGRRVEGTLHWVSADQGLPAEVRLYDVLFTPERPGEDESVEDFTEELNPDSLVVRQGALVEPSLAGAAAGERFQFERQGYFAVDTDSADGRLVFNRIVGLKDAWARASGDEGTDVEAARAAAAAQREAARAAAEADRARGTVSASRQAVRDGDPELAARFTRWQDELGLSESEADVLTGERGLSDFVEETLAAGAAPALAARWTVHELQRHLGEDGPAGLPFDAPTYAAFLGLVDGGTLTNAGGKQVLSALVERGGDPAALVDELGLGAVGDGEALAAAVAEVLAAHPDELARYRGGEQKLMGFFMGAVMRATKGQANPDVTRKVLLEQLEG